MMQIIDDHTLKNYDFLFVPSVAWAGFLKARVGADKVMHQKGGGFDFEMHEPKSKSEMRKELALSEDTKILIHVGRFNKLKGLETILEIYRKLKEEGEDVQLVVIGGNESEPLYGKLQSSGAVVKGYIPKTEVVDYMSASDVYLLPTEDRVWMPFADIDNTIIESLAMNRPVVSPMLIHFTGTPEERRKLGLVTRSREDALKAVKYVLDHPGEFRGTRSLMKKYYSWERILKNNLDVYDRLFEDYYGKNTIIHISPGAGYAPHVPDIETRRSATWATPFSCKTLEYTKEYDIEVWKVYDPRHYGHHGVSVQEEDGVTFRLFPGRTVGGADVSIPLLRELRRRIRSKERILVHLETLHELMPYLITLLCRRVPVLASQRGPGGPPIEMFRTYRRNPLYLPLQVVDSIMTGNLDFVFASSIGEYNYLRSIYRDGKVMLERGGGWEFDEADMVPGSREQLRRELGLPEDRKIIIYVGHLDDKKGLPVLLEVYKRLKEKMGVELLLVGGLKDQPLYHRAVESGAIVKERVSHEEMLRYIKASDVLVLLLKSRKYQMFAGLGTVVIEAASLGIPVVSSSLIHFQGTTKERQQLGYLPGYPASAEEVEKGILEIFDDPGRYSGNRAIARKYFSWDTVMKHHVDKYRELFESYYDRDHRFQGS